MKAFQERLGVNVKKSVVWTKGLALVWHSTFWLELG